MKQPSALVRPMTIKPRKTLVQKDLPLHPVSFKVGQFILGCILYLAIGF